MCTIRERQTVCDSVHPAGVAVWLTASLAADAAYRIAVSARKVIFRLTPCQYELTAILQRIASEQARFSLAGGVIFLLDGSGSVSQGR